MSAKLSQKEYLKKYLSGGSDKKKKKKDKKVKTKSTTVKIIDDDVHGGNSLDDDEEVILTGEDAPQIVGVYEATMTNGVSKWKKLGEIEPEIKQEIPKDDDPWGKKATSHTMDLPNPTDRSPPRQTKPMRRNSDQSPPRRSSVNQFKATRDQSSVRKRSPVYRKRDSDQSPPRKNPQRRMSKNSDQSPERRHRSRWNTNQSPLRRRGDSHQSPSRRRSAGRTSDQSPPRKRSPKHSHRPPPQRHSRNDSDLSPVRIKRQHSTDQSPPRRRNNSNPFKTTVKLERQSPDISPVRHSRYRQDSDQSPPRIKRERNSESPPPTHKPNSNKMTTTLDGKRAGLQDARTLKLETEERRRIEDLMFSQMPKEVSGRDAEVQVRQSSSYRRRRKDLEEDPEMQRKKAEHEQKKKEIYDRWNKGLKQVEASDAKRSDEQYESTKPLARYSNDADLDEMLKQKERDDDPMLAYMRSKKKEQLEAANIPVMPMYKGSYPENRFAIPPGYRWDGVDRSNGYEKKWFDVQNQKKALEDEAYKYSTEDM